MVLVKRMKFIVTVASMSSVMAAEGDIYGDKIFKMFPHQQPSTPTTHSLPPYLQYPAYFNDTLF